MRIEHLFSEQAQNAVMSMSGPSQPRQGSMISLAYGLADPSLFPRAELTAAVAAVLKDDSAAELNYGPTFLGLREQIVARLRTQGIEAEDETCS